MPKHMAVVSKEGEQGQLVMRLDIVSIQERIWVLWAMAAL